MRYQSGMTFIELMIASALGIILVTGVITLSITINRSVDLSDGLSRNQENGRFTMDYLTRYVRKAGYSEDSTNPPLALYIQGDTSMHCTPAVKKACADDDRNMSSSDSDDISGDKLAIPFFASEEMTACTGEVVSGNETFVNVFWVNSKKQLLCRVFNASTRIWHSDGNATIINGVENMQVQMGLASSKQDKESSTYVSIGPNVDLNLIRSIRVSILVSSHDPDNEKNNSLRAFTKKYGLLDSEPVSMNDGYIRHVFTNTIDLPNMIAGAK